MPLPWDDALKILLYQRPVPHFQTHALQRIVLPTRKRPLIWAGTRKANKALEDQGFIGRQHVVA